MKKYKLQSRTLLAVLGIAVLCYTSCDSSSKKQKEQDPIIGTWCNESVGQKGDDILKTTIDIQDDAKMNVTFEDSDTTTSDIALWKTDGDDFYYAYEEDDNPDRTEDLSEEDYHLIKLQWGVVGYKISGNTLSFIDKDNNRVLWEFTKK